MEIFDIATKRGFFFPSSEIYGGVAGFWEYGPLGNAMKNNFVELWRKEMVRRDEMIEIDGCQIMPKNVFIASGHIKSFVDPIVECKKCKKIFRADKLIEEKTKKIIPERLIEKKYDELIKKYKIKCKCGGNFEKTKKFNLMFSLEAGAKKEKVYLRPETCQSIFVDFPRLFKIMRCKLPVCFAQYGKSFRNEISPRQGLLRLREFYQAEMEIFFNPKKENNFEKFENVKNYRLKLFHEGKEEEISCEEAVEKKIVSSKLVAYYLALLQQFYEKVLDIKKARFRKLKEEEKAFYAKEAWDFEVLTNIGWVELVACNHRSDYDLSAHEKTSKKDMKVFDENKKILPNIFELSMGVDRSIFCILEHAFFKEKERNLLMLPAFLAPITLAIFPLVNKNGLQEKALSVYESLKKNFSCIYDDSGSIGRRYRRMDEIGTPFCITIDYQTLKDDTVTIRERDSMKQERITISKIAEYTEKFLK